MQKKGKIRSLLATVVLGIVLLTQAMFVKTAVFAENREKEQITENSALETAAPTTDSKSSVQILAQEYNVELEYVNYILEVEKTFQLEPYELAAIIAQETKFISKTRMDGNSLSYSTTQMKLPTAKTAYMAITEYYKMDIPYPTHELLSNDKYYATMLAGGYLKYLHDTYQDKYETYTAYHQGIGGRLQFYKKNGHFKSAYALQVAELKDNFVQLK